MEIIGKKQEQIELLIKEALDLQEQVQQIFELAAQVSGKFDEIGNNIQKSSKAAGKLAKAITKSTKYKGMSKSAGDITELGMQIVGEGVKRFGEWYAGRKEKKMLEKLLPKKQEVAKAKKDVIIRLIPKIERSKKSVEKLCENDASTFIDFEDQKRFKLVYEGTKKLFEAYFILQQSELICKYLIEEFSAWLDGNHFSNYEMPDTEEIVYGCMGDFIDWSIIPNQNVGYDLPKRLSVGGVMVLTDSEISEYSYAYEKVYNLALSISKSRILSYLMPFSDKAKRFREFYNIYLSENEHLNYILKRKKRKWYALGLLIFVVILLIFIKSF